MKTIKTFAKNVVANYGQKIIRSGIGLLVIGLIARYLGPDTFGQYAYILAFLTLAEVTAGMGVPVILCREVAKDKTKASTLIASGLTLQFFLSMITLMILSLIFYLLAPSRDVFWAASICAVGEILKFLGRFFWSVFQAYEKMGFGTLQTLISQTLYLIFVAIAIHGDRGLTGIFSALLLSHLAGAVFGYIVVTRVFVRLEFKNVKKLCLFFLKESYTLAIRGIFRKLNYRAGTLFLGSMKSSFEVGMFNGAHKIILNLVFVSEASSQAIFPILSRFSVSSRSSLETAFQKVIKFSLLIGLPLAIFLSTFSDEIIVLILGSKFIDSAPVLSILGWALVPLFMAGFTQRILVAENRQGLTTITMAAALGVNVVLCLSLIPKIGYTGAGIATLAGETVPLFLNLYFVWKYLGLHIRVSAILKPVLAGFATWGVLAIMPDVNLLVGGIAELLVYGVALVTLKTFSEDEIGIVKELLRGVSTKAVSG